MLASRFVLFVSMLPAPGIFGQAAPESSPVVLTLSVNASAAEIQKALDGLPPHGEVLLSAGTYEISKPLMLRHDYETLLGSGPATILHLADGAGCPVVILGPPLNETKTPAAHLLLANLLIDGNRKNQKLELWRIAGDGSVFDNNGVQIWNVTDAAVEHVICCCCRSGGLVAASVRRLRISDFDSYDNEFDGLACYQTEDSRFDGLRLHENLAAGISLDLGFNDNSISNAALDGNDSGIFMRQSRDNSFNGLIISKSHHDGIFMAQAAVATAGGWQLCPDTQCNGNSFENLVVSDCGGRAFQVNDASCTNNAISGARFQRNLLGGLGQPATHPIRFLEVTER
jgi:hypothetical protein